jgi:hypothetical protein
VGLALGRQEVQDTLLMLPAPLAMPMSKDVGGIDPFKHRAEEIVNQWFSSGVWSEHEVPLVESGEETEGFIMNNCPILECMHAYRVPRLSPKRTVSRLRASGEHADSWVKCNEQGPLKLLGPAPTDLLNARALHEGVCEEVLADLVHPFERWVRTTLLHTIPLNLGLEIDHRVFQLSLDRHQIAIALLLEPQEGLPQIGEVLDRRRQALVAWGLPFTEASRSGDDRRARG